MTGNQHETNHDRNVTESSPDSYQDGSSNGHDGGEKGEEGGSHEPVGVFHSSLNKLRLHIFGLWLRTVVILCAFIIAILSLYWGVLLHVEQNTSSLNVFVVNFDGTQSPYSNVKPLVGPMIIETTEKMLRSQEPHLGYITKSPSDFNNNPLGVRQAIYDFHAYAAIIINANATALLQAAVEQGNASYDPLGACQIIYVQARDQDTYAQYVTPQLNALQTEVTSKFGQMWTKMVLQNTSIPVTNLQAVPQALSPAIGFSQFNLRPFTPATTTPAVTVGLIYLIIIAFFSFSFFLPIYMKFVTPEGHPPIPFYKLVIIRYIGTILAYFFLSLSYSLVSLAFQIPFSSPSGSDILVSNPANPFGKGTFVVYWMLNFIGMCSLGLASENVTMTVGQPWTALWLIFWVITNVSTSFYSLDLSPKFFYWGYAWPLHNIVEGSRTLLFDVHSRLGLNFGVLLAWTAINSTLFPLCCFFMRYKTQKAEKAKKEK